MATIIDALVVTLTLDAASFQRTSQQISRRLDQIQMNLRKTGDAGEQMGLSTIKGATGASLALRGLTTAFVALPLAAVGAAAAVAAAFLKVSAAVTQADREILTMSRTTDIGASRMNAYGAIAERYFGSRQGAEQSAAKLTGKLQQLRMGMLSPDDEFLKNAANFRLSTRGSGGASVATTDEFRSRLIADMHRRAMRGTEGRLEAVQEGEAFNLDVGSIQAAIASNNYEAEVARQEELARVTPGGLKASEGWGQSLSDLQNAWTGLMREMIEPIEKKLTPAVQAVTGYIKEFGDWYAKVDWDKIGTFITTKFPEFTKALKEIAGYEWSRMVDAFQWLFEKIDKLLGTNISGNATADQEQYQPTSTTGEAWARLNSPGLMTDQVPQSAGQLAVPIRKALMDRGITNPDSQDALLGVLFSESGLRPDAQENNGAGPGRGLAQITPDKRKEWYRNFLGMPVEQASAYDQTRAIIEDMKENYPAVYSILMDNSKSRDEKVRAITRTFESPANVAARVVQDQHHASQFGETYTHPKDAPPPAPKPKPNTDPGLRPQLPFFTGWNMQTDGARQFAALDGSMQTAAAANSNTVTIGNVTVNTQATDAAGIARDMHGALQSQFGNPRFMALPANTAVA